MKNILIFLILTLLVSLALACGATERPGEPHVYAYVSEEINCATLQEWFDTWIGVVERRPGTDLATIYLAYSEYAHERMEEVGCYE